MRFKIAFIFVLAAIALVFHSCFSPQNVVRLQPEKGQGTWLYGQQFVSDSIDGVIYEVGFDQVDGNRYWFDFSITNRSNLPILIDPMYFYIQAFDGKKQPLTEDKVAAVDPENEIMKIDKLKSKNDARGMNQLSMSLLAATVDVASGIAAVADDDPENDHERTHLLHHSMAMAAQTSSQNALEAQSLEVIKDAWKNTTIRKTTLGSNYSMKGRVFFPAFPEAAYIKLYLPVDNKCIELGYQQIQFPVN